MKRIYITLLAEHIEFDTNEQLTEVEMLKDVNFCSDTITQQEIEDLFHHLLRIKGDWITYDLTENHYNIYLVIKLLYPYFNGEKEKNIPSEIYNELDKFISTHKVNTSTLNENMSLYKVSGYGSMYVIEKPSELDETNVFEQLKENNIPYEIISNNTQRTESGAGAEFSEAIIFIKDSVASGVAYDLLKAGILMSVSYVAGNINRTPRKAGNINYKNLLKDISTRVNVKPNQITLTNMYAQEDETIFEFRANGNYITVICDEDNLIKEFNYEDNVTIS
ncbi:hypothetical protein [Metabacillus indicus]|uniref:hypothetical protein n=1 Tax=Metabacillus indicus TaxID=246786 RepID=UPI00049344C6|nr:hypothetical protein [Metabacillus indicus]KEZ47739.1 hypothetical protein AZ46_0220305 [Metabacillus indicus LMG 22858]